MSAWRRHARFRFADAEGVLRVLRDVVVQRLKNGSIVATGSEPAVVGEMVTVHLVGPQGGDVRARVVDSRPVLVDGFVRHRIRLAAIDRRATPIDLAAPGGVAEAE